MGAGSVVLDEVPPNCTVVGIPGVVVKDNRNVFSKRYRLRTYYTTQSSRSRIRMSKVKSKGIRKEY